MRASRACTCWDASSAMKSVLCAQPAYGPKRSTNAICTAPMTWTKRQGDGTDGRLCWATGGCLKQIEAQLQRPGPQHPGRQVVVKIA